MRIACKPTYNHDMPFGINLRADGDASSYWKLVDRASALEEEPTIRALGYPPHITLAKYETADHGELEAVLSEIADTPSLTLTFDCLGSFDPGFLILWAAPSPQYELNQLHAHVHSIIDPARCRPPYRPGSWTPHCSIALRVSDGNRAAANSLVKTPITPFTLTFNVVDFVVVPPITIGSERCLKAAA